MSALECCQPTFAAARDDSGRVSCRELRAWLAEAESTTTGVPGIAAMARHVAAVARTALADRPAVQIADVDAILAACEESLQYRIDHDLPDVYAESRARTVDICTRLRAELVAIAGRRLSLLETPSSGDLIRSRREAFGWTQRGLALTLADHLHEPPLSEKTIRRWEHDRGWPKYRYRAALAAIFGGDPADYEQR